MPTKVRFAANELHGVLVARWSFAELLVAVWGG